MASNDLREIELLQASVDPEDESHLRILVDQKSIKYLIIDPGVYDVDDLCFGPALIPLLPVLQSGDWNECRISKNETDGKPYVATNAKVDLPRVTHIWHPLQIEYLDLKIGRKIRSNVYEVQSSHFDEVVIAKFALFSWEIGYLEAETVAYEWIEDRQIGPKFLGHLLEHGRVIGFLIERIADFRHATPVDLGLCHGALSRLHALGIKHGDTNKHNFLIHDGRATLIDFDNAQRCSDTEAMEEEYQKLQEELQDMSGRGGRIVDGASEP